MKQKILHGTQPLSPEIMGDYLKSLKTMQKHAKKKRARFPLIKFISSIEESIELAPAWVRQMHIQTEDALELNIEEYDYTIDIIFGYFGGQKNTIGSDLGLCYYLRIRPFEKFLRVIEAGWDRTGTKYHELYKISPQLSPVASPIQHNDPHAALIDTARNRT